MPTAKPFSWTVRFTVAPLWVQDGFTLGDERALHMLAAAVGAGSRDELQAVVLEAPRAGQLADMQGYVNGHHRRERVMIDIAQEHAELTGKVSAALRTARKLLDSVAFVAKEGDTAGVIAALDEALDLIDCRRGEAVEVEA